MANLTHTSPDSVFTGWDFSTTGVKCLAFDLEGKTLAEVRLPTDLWTEGGVSELSILQLEGQARASVRAMASQLRDLGRLSDWVAGGISATHHTAGRIDANHCQVRRAICWNDQSLAAFHAPALARLGGQEKVRELIGGPWAIRYSLTHLVKDETQLPDADWKRTYRILTHGSLAAGFLTGNFDVVSVSSAASTGMMDLRTNQWCPAMFNALAKPEYRILGQNQLPQIIDHFQSVGPLSPSLTMESGMKGISPIIFPTSDDQQAGLAGGGAVDSGQMAIILGSSAVVNSSSSQLPVTDNLDAMKLNWGPYLWMRCYTNGAQFLNKIVGAHPDWDHLEKAGKLVSPGCDGVSVLPFVYSEPSLGVHEPKFGWAPHEPSEMGKKFRASLEALSYLIALGVRQHRDAGQKISRISVSGGVARSPLMCEILASVLNHPLELLQSDEGPALGAAVTALAAWENSHRQASKREGIFSVGDAAAKMVRFRGKVLPNPQWVGTYQKGLQAFESRIGM